MGARMWHQRWLEKERVIITKAQRRRESALAKGTLKERERHCATLCCHIQCREKVCCIALWPLLTTWEQMRMREENGRPKSLVAKRGDDDEFLASQQQRQPQRRGKRDEGTEKSK